jgi:hypothetical protein
MRPLLVLLAAAVASPVLAADPPPKWSFDWNARVRWEHVDSDAFAEDADAATLRLRAGVRRAFGRGWSAGLEGEGVAALVDDYNSGANGHTAFPAVIDPTGIEVNQLWLAHQGPHALWRVGRQRLVLDNQRWLGSVGWRQNEQTFDAIAWEWNFAPAWTLRWYGLASVQRVAGDHARDRLARERDLASHFVNVTRKGARQQWTAYAYLHDDRDVAAASTATYGARWHGDSKDKRWGLTLEAATQQDHADNPNSFRHGYFLAEPSFAWKGATLRAGWEHLGGDGMHALQTPLATLHAFNGWADVFLVTPPRGLDDRYLAVSGKWGGAARRDRSPWQVAWHDYRADDGGMRYGREWNASLGFPVAKGLDALVKFADYRADGFARDTRKVWFQLEWSGKRP